MIFLPLFTEQNVLPRTIVGKDEGKKQFVPIRAMDSPLRL